MSRRSLHVHPDNRVRCSAYLLLPISSLPESLLLFPLTFSLFPKNVCHITSANASCVTWIVFVFCRYPIDAACSPGIKKSHCQCTYLRSDVVFKKRIKHTHRPTSRRYLLRLMMLQLTSGVWVPLCYLQSGVNGKWNSHSWCFSKRYGECRVLLLLHIICNAIFVLLCSAINSGKEPLKFTYVSNSPRYHALVANPSRQENARYSLMLGQFNA